MYCPGLKPKIVYIAKMMRINVKQFVHMESSVVFIDYTKIKSLKD